MKVTANLDKARPYQRELIEWFVKDGGKHGAAVWHRRAGKDRTATFIESVLALQRVGLYWHALPEFRHARRVIWDNITGDGQRLIDISFPDSIIAKRSDQEMKIELKNGSIWQVVGADNFNSLVGSNPVHVTLSEFAIMNPSAREFLRPILAENNGSELEIYTPRGYNHGFDLYEHAKHSDLWYCSLLTVDDTGVISRSTLEEERRTMPDELFRQEYYCDFSAANVGAILGSALEAAEKENRVHDFPVCKDLPTYLSSDIGFRDTASWWFWQPTAGGFELVDYDEDTGMDAGDWIQRLNEKGYNLQQIFLPHDAKTKSFATKHSAEEQFSRAFRNVRIVPQSRKLDRINAARVVIKKCRFHRTNTAKGLAGLRAWSFKWDDVRKAFSKEPNHDWASHPGDGYSYGAQMMREIVSDAPGQPTIRDAYGMEEDAIDWMVA